MISPMLPNKMTPIKTPVTPSKSQFQGTCRWSQWSRRCCQTRLPPRSPSPPAAAGRPGWTPAKKISHWWWLSQLFHRFHTDDCHNCFISQSWMPSHRFHTRDWTPHIIVSYISKISMVQVEWLRIEIIFRNSKTCPTLSIFTQPGFNTLLKQIVPTKKWTRRTWKLALGRVKMEGNVFISWWSSNAVIISAGRGQNDIVSPLQNRFSYFFTLAIEFLS